MAMIALSHIMLTVMLGFMIVYGVMLGLSYRTYKEIFIALTYSGLGILVTGFWLIPALKGDILKFPTYAIEEAEKKAFFPLRVLHLIRF